MKEAGADLSEGAADATLDPADLRTVLGHYPTGIAVVAAVGPAGPIGMLVGSFTSVSLEPPLVAFLPQKDSKSYAELRNATQFCVNILSADQEPLCRGFASKEAVDKWAGVEWSPSPSGAPRLDEAVAWIDCTHERTVDAGDHDIVLGRVQALGVTNPVLPLLFYQGGYGRFHSGSLVVPPEEDLLGPIQKADIARPELERLATELNVNCGLQANVGPSLVFIATASPGDGRSILQVGRRMPHVPPVGSPFVAWSDQAAIDTWMGRLLETPTSEQRRALLAGLERVRERGYSVAVQSPDFIAALSDLRNIDSQAANAEREIVRLVASLEGLYEPASLDLTQGRSVRLLGAPIFSPAGKVEMVVQLWDLPPHLTAAEVFSRATRLRAAARAIESMLAAQTHALTPASQPQSTLGRY
ncbi:flavin reductase [Nocardioides sp.]|uniref:flavin reductase n=1 Tax=Nocardioides sp. TaxID=35761 RepID=UPI003D1183F5